MRGEDSTVSTAASSNEKIEKKKSKKQNNITKKSNTTKIASKPRKTVEFHLPNDGSEFDSEEEEVNRIGDVPLHWYNEEDHIGYTAEGKKLMKSSDLKEIEKLLRNKDDPDAWRIIVDKKNNQMIRLTDTDIQAIRRVREGKIPIPSFDFEDSYVEFDNPDIIFPARNTPEPKSRFLPSKWEAKMITKLVKLIRAGKLPLKPNKTAVTSDVFDLWGSAITEEMDAKKKLRALPPPKVPLPGHSESYNPPAEYLFTKEEEKEWKQMDPEDRPTNFIPMLFKSLRSIAAYPELLKERFDRCLDLYLCPRALKMRMNIDEDSLLPPLPAPSNFEPFPSRISIDYEFRTKSIGSRDTSKCIRGMAVESSGHWLAAGGDDKVLRVFEVLTGKLFFEWKFKSSITALCWHPNLPIIAVAAQNEFYLLQVDLPNVRKADEPRKKSKKPNNRVDLFAAANELLQLPDESATTWKKVEHSAAFLTKQLGVIGGLHINHETPVEQIAWHHKGQYVAAVSSSTLPSQQCAIHALHLKKSIHPLKGTADGKVRYVNFHPTKHHFYAAYQKCIKVFDLKRTAAPEPGKPQSSLVQKLMGADDISCFAIHHNGDHVAVGADNMRLTWFDMELSNKPYKVLRCHKRMINSVGFHRHYPLLFSTSTDGSIQILHAKVFDDVLQNPLVLPLKQLHHGEEQQKPIVAAQWHPQNPWIFTADEDGGIHMWA